MVQFVFGIGYLISDKIFGFFSKFKIYDLKSISHSFLNTLPPQFRNVTNGFRFFMQVSGHIRTPSNLPKVMISYGRGVNMLFSNTNFNVSPAILVSHYQMIDTFRSVNSTPFTPYTFLANGGNHSSGFFPVFVSSKKKDR